MFEPSEPTYSPVADPRDPRSVPLGLAANDEILVPLPPRLATRARTPPWIRNLRDRCRLVTSFCYSDRLLLNWETRPTPPEESVRRIGPAASLTLDVPYYAFFSASRRAQALARCLGAIQRGVRRWEPRGIETIPLIKGLHPNDWAPQLDLAASFGLRRAAYYAREARLEHDATALSAFVKSARRRRMRPLLVGAYAPPRIAERPWDAAGAHHYVLARRRRILSRSGRPRSAQGGVYSDLLHQFLDASDVQALGTHNFRRVRTLLARPPPLTAFGLQLS